MDRLTKERTLKTNMVGTTWVPVYYLLVKAILRYKNISCLPGSPPKCHAAGQEIFFFSF